jgi:hypothetical protein
MAGCVLKKKKTFRRYPPDRQYYLPFALSYPHRLQE